MRFVFADITNRIQNQYVYIVLCVFIDLLLDWDLSQTNRICIMYINNNNVLHAVFHLTKKERKRNKII